MINSRMIRRKSWEQVVSSYLHYKLNIFALHCYFNLLQLWILEILKFTILPVHILIIANHGFLRFQNLRFLPAYVFYFKQWILRF